MGDAAVIRAIEHSNRGVGMSTAAGEARSTSDRLEARRRLEARKGAKTQAAGSDLESALDDMIADVHGQRTMQDIGEAGIFDWRLPG